MHFSHFLHFRGQNVLITLQAELKDSRLTASQNRIVNSLTKKQIDEYKEAFMVFDKDGDGHITPNEMEAALKAMGS